MDLWNDMPFINGSKADPVMISEYHSIIFTIPSASLQETIASFVAKFFIATKLPYKCSYWYNFNEYHEIAFKTIPDDYKKKYIFSIANNKFSIKNKDNILSVYYNTLGGNTEFEIENGTNWSEDVQFELQTSKWNEEKKFRIIMNGKTVIEKVFFNVG